jgi:hypothetical protein
MDSWLYRLFACSRSDGGHQRQMKVLSCISCLMGYLYSHLIPIGQGSVMGLQSLPGVLHTLKIIH